MHKEHLLQGHRKLKDVLQGGPQFSLLRVRGRGWKPGHRSETWAYLQQQWEHKLTKSKEEIRLQAVLKPSPGAWVGPSGPSLRTCCLATCILMPRLVSKPTRSTRTPTPNTPLQPALAFPALFSFLHPKQLGNLPLTQQVQAFSPGQDAPAPHPPGTPRAPAQPGSHLLAQPEQNPSSLLLLFLRHLPSPRASGTEPYWALRPQNISDLKMPRSPDSTTVTKKILRTFIQSLSVY